MTTEIANTTPITGDSSSTFRTGLSWLLWPLLLAGCIALTAVGMSRGQGPLFFNIAYLCLAVSLFMLERWMPHEPMWNQNDGQIFADFAHTMLNKGMVQLVVLAPATFGISMALGDRSGGGYWPTGWPMVLQVLLGLFIAEIGLYWAHRLGHEVRWLWPYHAVHHSVTRLWFFNTGRFHFVDTIKSIVLGMPLLFLCGSPGDVFLWVSMITAFIGMLTHCNVEMRFGPLNYVFNTPALHRWHHSRDLREGNKNYGENLMIWDVIFRTYFDADRRPPVDIGIAEQMPTRFADQLKAPFMWRRLQGKKLTAES